MTTQLAVEMQLFLLAPLMVWLYHSNGDIGFMVYGAIHAVSVAARFSRTNTDSLSSTLFHGMNVSKFYRTANVSLASPLHRATAYLVGVGTGLLLESKYEIPRFPKAASIAGWAATVWCIFWCFWYPSHSMSPEYVYDSTEAAVYASWAPLAISLAIAWIILMTYKAELPFILEKVLSSKPVVVLGNISYPLQLVTYTVVLFSTAQHKEIVRFHSSDLINLKEIFVIVVLSLLLAVFVDIPFRSLRKLLLTTVSTEASVDSKDISSQDPDQVELIKNDDESSFEHKEEEKEIIEDIWGSETEKDDTTFKRTRIFEEYKGSSFEDKKLNSADENWRTESDLEENHSTEATSQSEPKKNFNKDENEADEDVEESAEDDEEIDEEDEEINEEDEIIRRPASPEPLFRRRRRQWNVDED